MPSYGENLKWRVVRSDFVSATSTLIYLINDLMGRKSLRRALIALTIVNVAVFPSVIIRAQVLRSRQRCSSRRHDGRHPYEIESA